MSPAERAARNEKIIAFYREGHTQPQLAKRFGLTQAGISSIMRRYGISPQDGGIRVRSRRYDEIEARARARRDLMRKHRFLNILYPPFPNEVRA